ncbi:hypothetical protein EDB80DRAFT_809798 [Ilyonectria destructans]|nr:hypothetical protein EDB80DRAFT_809798 [Ilyonectria destructans]
MVTDGDMTIPTIFTETISHSHEPAGIAKIKTENKSNVLAPADRALESCAKFSTRLTKSSSYTGLSDKYANEIATANRDTLRDMLRQHLNDANAAERRFEQQGKVRRFYQRTTRFLSTFGRYLDGYGGVVELMSTLGGQYGKAAYSTLSILLVVAVNKQKRDDRIGEILLQLCKQYSRFKILEHIHPTSEMQMHLANAYEIGIEFARQIMECGGWYS